MKRVGPIVAAAVLVLTSASTPPAAGQNGSASLSPRVPTPPESAGAVVITVSMWRAGRVAYQTYDGACAVEYSATQSPPTVSCWEGGRARASEDYVAASGELIFTQGGSQTITITLVDDSLDEDDESFTLAAWEEVNADPWIDRGDSATVLVVDDDGGQSDGDPAQTPPTSSTNRGAASSSAGASSGTGQPGSQLPGAELDGPTPTSQPARPSAVTAEAPGTTTTALDLEVALPDGDLRPGAGFELTGDAPPEGAATPGDSPSGLVIGSGTAALGVGGLAVIRRRRRWSATQA